MSPAPDIEAGGVSAPSSAAAGESTPLVPLGGGGGRGGEDDDEEPLEDVEECTSKEKIVGGVAAVATAASVVAMAVEGHPSVYLSGAAGVVVAPYSAFQQQKMTDVEALQETNERLGQEVGNLQAENDRLQASVGQLEKSVEKLQDLEETLETIKKSETKGLDALERQLAEQKEILASMKGNLRATVMQNLVSVVLACDKDGDMTLSDEEIDLVIQKIENLNNVELKEKQLRALIVGSGRNLSAVMEVGRNLLDDNVPKEKRIFKLRE